MMDVMEKYHEESKKRRLKPEITLKSDYTFVFEEAEPEQETDEVTGESDVERSQESGSSVCEVQSDHRDEARDADQSILEGEDNLPENGNQGPHRPVLAVVSVSHSDESFEIQESPKAGQRLACRGQTPKIFDSRSDRFLTAGFETSTKKTPVAIKSAGQPASSLSESVISDHSNSGQLKTIQTTDTHSVATKKSTQATSQCFDKRTNKPSGKPRTEIPPDWACQLVKRRPSDVQLDPIPPKKSVKLTFGLNKQL